MQVAESKWFEGRQGRFQFFKHQIISGVVGIFLIALPSLIETIFPSQHSANDLLNQSLKWFDVASAIIYLMAIGLSCYISFPSICKRLHDLGYSAKWLPIYVICNLVLFGLPFIVVAHLPSNKTSNKYGEVPK